jgi:hypothetical protein
MHLLGRLAVVDEVAGVEGALEADLGVAVVDVALSVHVAVLEVGQEVL